MKALAVRNGLWNASATSLMSVTSLLGSVLVVRILSPEQYGTFSYYMWLAAIVVATGTLAFPLSLTKMTSELIGESDERESNALSFSVLILVFGINLLIIAGLVFWALSVPTPQRLFILIIAGVALPSSLSGVALSILWGQQRYKPVSITLLFACLVQVSLMVVAYQLDWGIAGFMIAALSLGVVHSIGIFAILVREALHHTSLAFRLPHRRVVRRYGAFLAPATLSQLITIIVWERSEVFFLERFSTLTQVGIYSLAYTTVALSLTLGWALVNAFYPAISNDFGAGKWSGIQQKFTQGTSLAILYAVPLTFGGWVTMEALFRTLYGEKMHESVLVAQILFAGLVPGVVGGMFGITLGALGAMWLLVRVGVVIAIINIALALVLIPLYGASGAALANTGSQIVHVGLLFAFVTMRYGLSLPWQSLARVVAVGLLTALILPMMIQALIPGIAGLVLAIGVAGCSYCGAIWALGYLHILQPPEVSPIPVH